MTAANQESTSYHLYTDMEYRAELEQRIHGSRAGARILLMSMTFDPEEPPVAKLMDAAMSAAERGVHVTLSVDAHSFLTHDGKPGPLVFKSELPGEPAPPYDRKKAVLDQLNALPTGKAHILNKPSHILSLAIAGRSHIKIAMVDDYCFIGGCNLQGTEAADIMIGFQNGAVCDKLYNVMQHILDTGNTVDALPDGDITIEIDSKHSLIIDAGVRGRSKIFDTACEAIDNADKHVYMTNQFFPNSTTADHLRDASNRGIDVSVVFSHPSHHSFVGGLGQHANIALERLRLPEELFEKALDKDKPMIHAKLLATDKEMMVGSHNYVTAGVKLGTAEIALHASDPALAAEAVRVFERSLAQKQV